MRKINVAIPNNNYYIYAEKGILNKSESLIRQVYKGNKIIIITDETVYSLYGEKVKKILSEFCVKFVVIPSGEQSKSIECLTKVYSGLIDETITRKDLIITFGGGVVGDLGGFAASTILRGVPFVQIPTTLLAQVDSSVGGKVGINLEQGKNLVGSFCQPKMVIIDLDILNTLDKRVLSDGMSEVIKYGLIKDKELFDKLYNLKTIDNLFDIIEDIVYTCCMIKAEIVIEDELELNIRKILNFGHTYGHVIEKHFKYSKYTHGEAVAIGMVMESLLGETLGITKIGTTDIIKDILEKYNLPTTVGEEKIDFSEAIKLDKKVEDDKINIILLNEIGKCEVHKLDFDCIKN